MSDLRTSYLGLELDNPIVVSASHLCEDVENIRAMERAGAAAVVLHSLFEEQITLESDLLDRHLAHGSEAHAEAVSYFPNLARYKLGPEAYLAHIRRAKGAVKIPIIGSLNGISAEAPLSWIKFARKIEDAGADALELNVYFVPTDTEVAGVCVEDMYCELIREVKAAIKIPLAVKISPYFSSMSHMAKRLQEAGADALVLFNRFYQPDFDVESLTVSPSLYLSTSQELLLRLHWVAILYPRLRVQFAVTGGVHSATDVMKSIMAGARVAMMTSALLENGISHITKVLADMQLWMENHEYRSVHQMRGSMSQWAVAEPAAFERANYLKVLGAYTMKPQSN